MSDLPITQLTAPTDRIELSIGQPDPKLLPAELFQQLNSDTLALAYGAPAGDGRFRDSLATWLSGHYGVGVSAESLMVTNGSSNALDLICARFSQPGDTVLVEDPTYFIARRQLADHGLKTVAMPMDAEGPDPAGLEALIEEHRPAFCYCIPTFHNPGGYTLSAERRAGLVAVARRTGCPLVADEVYQLLHFDAAPPPPLACFDDQAPVLSIGSFSKILAPGLRLGWIQSNGRLQQRLTDAALIASGGGLNPFTSALVRPLIDSGRLDDHLRQLRGTLAARRDALAAALSRDLNGQLSFTTPDGGYFIWARLSHRQDAEALLPEALKAGVGFLPGQRFSDHPDQARAMRLCFAFYDAADLDQACRRLASLF